MEGKSMPRITLDVSQEELNKLGGMCHINMLNESQIERLAILSEEMGEAQQIIGKILRHGFNSYNPNLLTHTTNRVLLHRELGHVLYAIDMLTDARDVDRTAIRAQTAQKANRIKPYLHYQENK
jgi:hypothetical protein